MSHFYVGCMFGEETGRVVLGSLHGNELQVSEIRRFPTSPLVKKDSVEWNVPELYQEVVEALRTINSYEEPIQSISCSSRASDYFLFDKEGAVITPAIHHSDPQVESTRGKLLQRVPPELIYEETGNQSVGLNMLMRLGAEAPKRLKKAQHVLPIADAFNFLLSGERRMELSMAGASSLYNPALQQWSTRLMDNLKLRSELLPEIVDSGTVLGKLRGALCKETGLDEVQVTASCSEETAAMLAGLPLQENENWVFINPGESTLVGTEVPQPIINEFSAQLNFVNQVSRAGNVCFYKRSAGLQILEECQRFWEQSDRSMDNDLLSHLAGSATPFESLIDPSDPRFSTPGDMPLKIQAFCKETNQAVPRKPGPVYRCVLESLALHFRKLVYELEHLSGVEINRIFVPNAGSNMLLNHFTANSLKLPLTIVSSDVPAFGNIVTQGLALGQIESVEAARDILRRSSNVETIVPYAQLWEQAYERFVTLTPTATAAE